MPDLDLSHCREELAHLGDLDVPRQVLHEDLHFGVDAGRVRLALLEAPAASATRGGQRLGREAREEARERPRGPTSALGAAPEDAECFASILAACRHSVRRFYLFDDCGIEDWFTNLFRWQTAAGEKQPRSANARILSTFMVSLAGILCLCFDTLHILAWARLNRGFPGLAWAFRVEAAVSTDADGWL